jgi:[ribosomal protein S18]-alanine N-acetyltransferase
MNAQAHAYAAPGSRRLERLQVEDLAALLAIEVQAYDFPWTRGNFVDSLAAGHAAWWLRQGEGPMLGYFLAMSGVEEMHLLNLTVAPAHQGRGHAVWMLDRLCEIGRGEGALQLWLEVRPSNERARRLYERYGFAEVGLRRGYYPTARGQREDALVMSLAL